MSSSTSAVDTGALDRLNELADRVKAHMQLMQDNVPSVPEQKEDVLDQNAEDHKVAKAHLHSSLILCAAAHALASLYPGSEEQRDEMIQQVFDRLGKCNALGKELTAAEASEEGVGKRKHPSS